MWLNPNDQGEFKKKIFLAVQDEAKWHSTTWCRIILYSVIFLRWFLIVEYSLLLQRCISSTAKQISTANLKQPTNNKIETFDRQGLPNDRRRSDKKTSFEGVFDWGSAVKSPKSCITNSFNTGPTSTKNKTSSSSWESYRHFVGYIGRRSSIVQLGASHSFPGPYLKQNEMAKCYSGNVCFFFFLLLIGRYFYTHLVRLQGEQKRSCWLIFSCEDVRGKRQRLNFVVPFSRRTESECF